MIGVYDSGFGGLTVLKELIKKMPNFSYMYFGDTLYAPYGDKEKKFIIERAEKIVNFLFKNKAKIVLLACNTVSAIALNHLQRKFKNKYIFDVLVPTSKKAAKNGSNIAVICTTATAQSKAFEKKIKLFNKNAKVNVKATPLLVPLIEEGLHGSKFTQYLLKEYLKYFDFNKIDTLVLGCTHYPIIKSNIKKIINIKNIIDTPSSVVDDIYDLIQKNKNIFKSSNKTTIKFFTTGQATVFKKLGSKILGKKINKVNIIKI